VPSRLFHGSNLERSLLFILEPIVTPRMFDSAHTTSSRTSTWFEDGGYEGRLRFQTRRFFFRLCRLSYRRVWRDVECVGLKQDRYFLCPKGGIGFNRTGERCKWGFTCKNCGRPIVHTEMDDTLWSYFFPAQPVCPLKG
jgi:hypothetical protein